MPAGGATAAPASAATPGGRRALERGPVAFARPAHAPAWPRIGSTEGELVHREGSLRLIRYAPAGEPARGAVSRVSAPPPLLMVLPLINRAGILDLTPATSWVRAVTALGVETYLLDWGAPCLADRPLGLEAYVDRLLPRCEARVRSRSGADAVVLGGFCLGGTLAVVRAARAAARGEGHLHAGLVTMNAPVSFSDAGILGLMTAPDAFPLDALLGAFTNMPGAMIQDGFQALKPFQQAQKLRRLFDRASDPDAVEEHAALEVWNADNVSVTGSFYRTLIEDLYRGDRLARGTLEVGGARVDLGAIRCPVCVLSAVDDPICLPGQAGALLERVSSATRRRVDLKGGHIRSVVGAKSSARVAEAIARFLSEAPAP